MRSYALAWLAADPAAVAAAAGVVAETVVVQYFE
jgi:hypothetical protein